MIRSSEISSRARRFAIAGGAIGAIAVLAIGSLLGFRLLTGRNLGFGLWRVKHLGLALLDRQAVRATANGDYTSVIFLHHSTGDNLIKEGSVRARFTEADYDFWDHHYNARGLQDPDGHLTGYSYRIPQDNTDPDGLARIFDQRVYPLPVNALSGLLQHEVIVFKSCFPASDITSDAQLQQYKAWYLGMRDTMDRHRDKVFVVMSPPPLNPSATTPEAAARARAFADWLTSDAYLAGHSNVFAFDFFDHLAEDDPAAPDYNMLRAEYRIDAQDSHPNQRANEAVGPAFADAVMAAAERYRKAASLTNLTLSDIMRACLLENNYSLYEKRICSLSTLWVRRSSFGSRPSLVSMGGPHLAGSELFGRDRRGGSWPSLCSVASHSVVVTPHSQLPSLQAHLQSHLHLAPASHLALQVLRFPNKAFAQILPTIQAGACRGLPVSNSLSGSWTRWL
jgi:hypothetical protein